MSDDATKTIQAEEPNTTATEVASEPATVTKSEETTLPDVPANAESGDGKAEGDVKTDSDDKAENQNGDSSNQAAKQEETEKKEADILKTSARHNQSNPRNNNKFDPSLAPVTTDPAKMPGQIRTQVR